MAAAGAAAVDASSHSHSHSHSHSSSNATIGMVPYAQLELAPGKRIDARDKEGKWVLADILACTANDKPDERDLLSPTPCDRARIWAVRVHFVGFHSKWDEWVSVYSSQCVRVQPPGHLTAHNTPVSSQPQAAPVWGVRHVRKHEHVLVYRVSPQPRAWTLATAFDCDGRQLRVQYPDPSALAAAAAAGPDGHSTALVVAGAAAGRVRQREYWFHADTDEVRTATVSPKHLLTLMPAHLAALPVPPSATLARTTASAVRDAARHPQGVTPLAAAIAAAARNGSNGNGAAAASPTAVAATALTKALSSTSTATGATAVNGAAGSSSGAGGGSNSFVVGQSVEFNPRALASGHPSSLPLPQRQHLLSTPDRWIPGTVLEVDDRAGRVAIEFGVGVPTLATPHGGSSRNLLGAAGAAAVAGPPHRLLMPLADVRVARPETPPSPYSVAKAAAAQQTQAANGASSALAAAGGGSAVPKLSIPPAIANGDTVYTGAAEDFDVFKLALEPRVDVRDRDGRWRLATIVDRAGGLKDERSTPSAALGVGHVSPRRTCTKVHIAYADASPSSASSSSSSAASVDAREWIDLERTPYRLQPVTRRLSAQDVPCAFRASEAVFVSPPPALSGGVVVSLVPTQLSAVWYPGTVVGLYGAQVLVEYMAPAPSGSSSGSSQPVRQRQWFHPLFQHITREPPPGYAASTTAPMAITPTAATPGSRASASASASSTAAATAIAAAAAATPKSMSGSGTIVPATPSSVPPLPRPSASDSGPTKPGVPSAALLSAATDVRVGTLLDARDSVGKWTHAVVRDLKLTASSAAPHQVFVHYTQWKDPRWDEWLDVDDATRGFQPRIAKEHVFSASATPHNIAVKERVHVLVRAPRDVSRYVDAFDAATGNAHLPCGGIAAHPARRWWSVDGWVGDAYVLEVDGAQVFVEFPNVDPVTLQPRWLQTSYTYAASSPSSFASSSSAGSPPLQREPPTRKHWFHVDLNEVRSAAKPLPSFPAGDSRPPPRVGVQPLGSSGTNGANGVANGASPAAAAAAAGAGAGALTSSTSSLGASATTAAASPTSSSGPLGTLLAPPRIPSLEPYTGLVCDCRDSDGRWCQVKVLGRDRGSWYIRFVDWDPKYDEHMTTPVFVDRSAPLGAFSLSPTSSRYQARMTLAPTTPWPAAATVAAAAAGAGAGAGTGAGLGAGAVNSLAGLLQLYASGGAQVMKQFYREPGARCYVYRMFPEPRTWVEAFVRKTEPRNLLVQVTYTVPVDRAGANHAKFFFHALSGEILPHHPSVFFTPGNAALNSQAAAAALQLFGYVQGVTAAVNVRRAVSAVAALATSPSASSKNDPAAMGMDVDDGTSNGPVPVAAEKAIASDDVALALVSPSLLANSLGTRVRLRTPHLALDEWSSVARAAQDAKLPPHVLYKAGVGLRNLGNSCYMGAALQALVSLPGVLSFFVVHRAHHHTGCSNPNIPWQRGVCATNGRLTQVFAQLADLMYEAHDNEVDAQPAAVKQVISVVAPRFGGYEQQDSHEFLNVFLEALHHELNITGASSEQKSRSYPKSLQDPATAAGTTAKPESVAVRADRAWRRFQLYNQSIVTALFYGLLQNRVTCGTCAYSSLSYDSFSSITLDLPRGAGGRGWSLWGGGGGGGVTLAQCFDEFCRAESIGADWNCERCRTKRAATKQITLYSLPPVLFVQLKRFAPDGSRVNTSVEFPMDLNVATWCEASARASVSAPATTPDPANGVPALPSYPLAGASAYRLHAVVLHWGRGRHYTALTKIRSTTTSKGVDGVAWAEFDDRQCTPLPESVLHGANVREAAYLLFYVRV